MSLFPGAPARAMSTYFEDIVMGCTVETATTAELRIQRGEGGYGPDPASLVLLDDLGRMIGFQPVYHKVFLTALGDAGCAAIDPHNLLIYQPDVAKARGGDSLGGSPVTDRGDMMRLSGQEVFGFSSRALAPREIWHASWQVVWARKGEAIGFVLLAFTGFAIVRGLIGGLKAGNHWARKLAFAAIAGLGLACTGLGALFLTVQGGLGGLQMAVSAIVGAALFIGWRVRFGTTIGGRD